MLRRGRIPYRAKSDECRSGATRLRKLVVGVGVVVAVGVAVVVGVMVVVAVGVVVAVVVAVVMSTIYLASNWDSKPRMRALRDQIQLRGHTVLSSWLDDPTTEYIVGSPLDALKDFDEIRQCDLLICDTAESSNTGGREVEFGFAWGRNIDVWLIGPRRNIFHAIADRHYTNWVDALRALDGGTDA